MLKINLSAHAAGRAFKFGLLAHHLAAEFKDALYSVHVTADRERGIAMGIPQGRAAPTIVISSISM